MDYKLIQGNVLRYMRGRSQKSLEESAKLCNHQRAWLSEIEHGRKNILFKDAKSLVTFYGYTLNEFGEMIDRELARESKIK